MNETPKIPNTAASKPDDGLEDGQLQATDIETRHSPEVMPIHRQIIREMNEPSDGVAPTPVWLMLMYFTLLMWGGYYIAANSGGFRADIYNEDPSALYRQTGSVAETKPVDLMTLGKRTFVNCTQCHQADGAGIAGTYPPLDGAERVSGPPHVLAAILLHGLQGPIQVKGQTYRGEMPSWNKLSDEEIAAVLTYVRASWSNKYPEVSPALVTAVRAQTASKAGPWSDEDLDALAKEAPPAIGAEEKAN